MKRYFRLSVVLVVVAMLLSGCIFGVREYTVSGVIKDVDGNPVEGVELEFRQGVETLGVAKTDKDGKWAKDGLGKSVLVTPVLEGWEFEPKSQTVTKKAQDVDFVGIEDIVIHVNGEGEVTREILEDGQLRLEAVAADGWKFDGWFIRHPWEPPYNPREDELDDENPIDIAIDEPIIVQAYFAIGGPTLTGAMAAVHSFPFSVEQETTPAPEIENLLKNTLGIEERVHNEYKSDELIVRYNSFNPGPQVAELQAAGYEVLDQISVLNAYLVKATDEPSLVQMELKGAISVERNGVVKPSGIVLPNDPLYQLGAHWHYDQIRLPQAWSVVTGDKSIRVAVVDTGIDPEHPDLVDNLDLEHAADFTGDRSILDFHGHGTHVAGTIGAMSDNDLLVSGVMWDVEILPVKVFGAEGTSSSWTIVQGMLYSAGLLEDEHKPYNPRPVDIINMSLGGPWSKLEEDAVKMIDAAGVIMVAASGNENRTAISYPAAHPEVIAVGAVGKVDKNDPQGFTEPPLASYSNTGPGLDVVAPGGAGRVVNDYVWSTYPTYLSANMYGGMGGTSMATPHVAGVIGLMLANGIEKSEVREILHRTAMEIHLPTPNPIFGHGLVNAYWAVNDVREMKIIQGLREGNTVEIAKEVILEPKGGQFLFTDLAVGEYQFIAWIDVNKNGIVDAGDYYAETPVLETTEASSWIWTGDVEELPFGAFEEEEVEVASNHNLVQVQ